MVVRERRAFSDEEQNAEYFLIGLLAITHNGVILDRFPTGMVEARNEVGFLI